MRSEEEIKEKIKQLELIYLDKSNTATQKLVIANKIHELKWAINDNSDDIWMVGG